MPIARATARGTWFDFWTVQAIEVPATSRKRALPSLREAIKPRAYFDENASSLHEPQHHMHSSVRPCN